MDQEHKKMNIEIARALGPESQLRQLMEECCELLLNQIMHLMSITDSELNETMEKKVDRTWQNIAAEKEWEQNVDQMSEMR